MLDYIQIDEIIDVITEKVIEKVTYANRAGNLETLLNSWGFNDLIRVESYYETDRNGKILLFGSSAIKEKEIFGIAKSLDIDTERLELHLEYDAASKYDFRKLRFDTKYRLIIFGPVPHSGESKGKYRSILSSIKNEEGYPRIEMLTSNRSLKITKTNLRDLFTKLIDEYYI